MDTVTHALLPVIICATAWRDKRPEWFAGRKQWFYLALAGALPDLLTPHLSIDARWSSWSHGLPFWLALSVVLLMVCSRWQLAVGASLAYGLHLFCDGISGGVNLLYPFRTWIWGDYWVPPLYWIPLDIVCVLTCYWFFRLRPLWIHRNNLRKKMTAVHAEADDGI
jgi:membrane-bound metal-dependent hydrolase YbcI (DUF457 family)